LNAELLIQFSQHFTEQPHTIAKGSIACYA